MNTTTSEKHSGKLAESIYYPSVVMIIPTGAGEISQQHLKQLTDDIDRQVSEKYRREKAVFVMDKLHHALSQIGNSGGKRSMAVFVSPVYETVIHLDTPLAETVLVDEPFEIRDLVAKMQPAEKYLVLVESEKEFRFFLGERANLIQLRVSIPDNIAAYKNDIAEKIEYFSDTSDRKEIMMDKFIHHIDKELDHILTAHPVPVFIMGTGRMNGHFKKYSHHGKSILDYIHGNYDDATPYQLTEVLKPYLAELKYNANKELSQRIEHALNANKLVFGIQEVWRNAMDKKGRTLLVERNYYYPHLEDSDGNLKSDTTAENPSLARDAVDVIIEKVLENGGDVKFTDEEFLKDFSRIALIQYY